MVFLSHRRFDWALGWLKVIDLILGFVYDWFSPLPRSFPDRRASQSFGSPSLFFCVLAPTPWCLFCFRLRPSVLVVRILVSTACILYVLYIRASVASVTLGPTFHPTSSWPRPFSDDLAHQWIERRYVADPTHGIWLQCDCHLIRTDISSTWHLCHS